MHVYTWYIHGIYTNQVSRYEIARMHDYSYSGLWGGNVRDLYRGFKVFWKYFGPPGLFPYPSQAGMGS